MAMNRREALARIGGIIGAGWLGGHAIAQNSNGLTTATQSALTPPSPSPGQSFSVAHITDVHIYEQKGAQAWFAKCLHDIQSHPSKPIMIINTGDTVMEVLDADRQRAEKLWAIWESVTKQELSLPIRHALGNHDYWAYKLGTDNPYKDDKLYGAGMAMQALGMEKLYDSFQLGNWEFILLDTIHPAVGKEANGWEARLDDEQFEWLKQRLEALPNDRPAAVYSHIPIVQIASMEMMKPNDKNRYAFNPDAMLRDARRVIDLFEKHPNVKLCLSGHIHLRDRVELANVTYICDGAVSGGWWNGPRRTTEAGYSITTFHPDGTFDHSYHGYGWDDSHLEKKAAFHPITGEIINLA